MENIFETYQIQIRDKKSELEKFIKQTIQKAFLELKNNIKSIDIYYISTNRESQYDDEGGTDWYLNKLILYVELEKMEKLIKEKNLPSEILKNDESYLINLTFYDEYIYTTDPKDDGFFMSQLLTKDELNILYHFRYHFLDSINAQKIPVIIDGKWE